jgi:ABC-type multidrug transport system fused ATPase/permease subunit
MTSESPPTDGMAPRAWGIIRSLIRRRAGRLVVAFGLMAVNRVSAVLPPLSMKFLVDDVIGRAQAQWLAPLFGGLLLLALVRALTSWHLNRILTRSSHEVVVQLREAVHARIVGLPLPFYDASATGTLVSRVMADVESVRYVVGNGLVDLLGSLLAALLAVGVLFYLNPLLTGILALLCGLTGYAMRALGRTIIEKNADRAQINAEVMGRLTDSIAGVRVIKTYRAERREIAAFGQAVRRLFEGTVAASNAALPMAFVTTVGLGAVSALATYVCARQILSGSMTLGAFMTYAAFLGLAVGPILQLSALGAAFAEMLTGVRRIEAILRERPEDDNPRRVQVLGRARGEVQFLDVHFSYVPARPVLNGITFVAPPGSVTALVGPSGAGKSTVMALLEAFYTPSSGQILIDGVDLATVRLDPLRTQLGVVMQDTFLFNSTLRDNITFARPDATEADIHEACRIARIDEFAERLERQLDTIVGERGVRLSGGQRQRIAIARAVLACPRILILDEATSNLDSELELAIHDALDRLARTCTMFIIAHRLSTVRRADQILVLDHGRIVERGRHDQLMRAGLRYAAMYREQQPAELERSY